MFDKLLIANRGEIACRIIKTARRLGIATVAVYSEADKGARHVEMADEAFPIGLAPARESYLSVERILEAAERSGARAIHPGYGFLSENAAFAETCAAAGIVFVGPPASAIRAMGSKSAARALMERAGVPIVPGYHGADQDEASLRAAAGRIGYPVLIKASSGGGGKGMRVVEDAREFPTALAAAKREAQSAFGDDNVLIEKYLTRPRHIEIQIFADRHGHVLTLFERDCSIQRRHQKVIEEAPAPGLAPNLRQAMAEAACAAARAVGYTNAGTVEFIVEGDAFYFMEMNTRLQVEHPVTEMITGIDLVEWQLLVAAGGALPLAQEDVSLKGHAIEARIYAEDPARDFLPSTGTLSHLRAPDQSAHLRIDTGVREGDAVSIHYDPMIAKLIVWDHDRHGAVRRLSDALGAFEVLGVRTNLSFLKAIADHPAFGEAELDTGFIARHGEALRDQEEAAPADALAAAVLRVLDDERKAAEAHQKNSLDPWSPWNLINGWRLNGEGYQDLIFEDGDRTVTVRAHPRADGCYRLDLPEGGIEAEMAPGGEAFLLSGVKRRLRVVRRGAELTIFADGKAHRLILVDPLAAPSAEAVAGGHLRAPMPGQVLQVMVCAGAAVTRGTPLIVLEAMKMDHTILAPADGVVEQVHFAPGDRVEEGADLIDFSPKDDGP